MQRFASALRNGTVIPTRQGSIMLNRLAQRQLLVFTGSIRSLAFTLLCFAPLSFTPLSFALPPAICPDNFSEQFNTSAADGEQLLVCVSDREVDGLKQLQLSFTNSKQQLQSTVPLDVEGELRAIRLASSHYTLKPGLRAVALVLELRNRGVGFDEERQELWLFWPKDNALSLVFNQTTALQRWATNCTQDCEDTLQSQSQLRVLSNSGGESSGSATGLAELAPLELRTQGNVTPANADEAHAEHFQRTERYEFQSNRYELVPEIR